MLPSKQQKRKTTRAYFVISSMTQTFFKILNECMSNLQEPFADYSIIPTYELTKNASKSFTVMFWQWVPSSV